MVDFDKQEFTLTCLTSKVNILLNASILYAKMLHSLPQACRTKFLDSLSISL